jgi:hAT family C-terminal dimerisation region
MRYRAIQASQNKSERAFSAAIHVMTDFLTTLDPEHLDELLLLHSQFKP